MVIRDAQPDDFDAIAEITNPYIQHTTIHFSYEPVTAEGLRAVWAKAAGKYPFLVAIDPADGVIGYAKASQWRERTAYDRTAELGIYLRKEFQRKGLGRVLYLRLIEACRAKGFHALIGGITMPNEPSVRLHLACGFVHIGTFPEVGWKFEGWHGVAFYQLML